MVSMRNAGGIMVALSAALLAACGGAQSRYQSHMSRGQAFYAKADFPRALIEFRNASQIAPTDPQAHLMTAQADERLGRLRDAAGLYGSILESNPDNLQARAGLARLLTTTGSSEQALKILAPGLKLHPNDPQLLLLRAAARAEQQDVTGATVDADRALKLAPDNVDALEVRAGLYKRERQFAAAIALINKAVNRSPDSLALHDMLADLYAAMGEAAKAEQQLLTLVRLAPAQGAYRYRLAVFYTRGHRPDDAQRVLEDAVKALPESDEAKLTLVDFLRLQRSASRAEQKLREFVAASPDNENLRLALAALLQGSALPQAIATYQEVIRRDGTGTAGLAARNRLAAIAWAQGKPGEAQRLIGEVLGKNATDASALALRGEIALAQSRPTDAIPDFRAVLRDSPDAVNLRRLLARAYVADGQLVLAAEAFRAALDLAPNDGGLETELAHVLEQTGHADQAAAVLRTAVQRAPNDPLLKRELATACLDQRDFAGALGVAEQLQSERPNAATGWYLAGLAQVGLKQLDDAEKQLEHALALEPGAYDALGALARLRLARGENDRAIALLKSSVQKDPGSAPLLNLQGEVYLKAGKTSDAVDTFNRAIAQAPKWWTPYRNLATAKLEVADIQGAIAAYRAAVQVAPGEAQLVNELGSLYETQGRADDAIALYDSWYRQHPQDRGAANDLALLLVTYRQDRASLDRARDLTAGFASSEDGRLLDTDGWVHFKRAEYSEALALLQRALEREPASNQLRYHIGMAELRAGRVDQARSDLEQAVAGTAKFPGVDDARNALAALKQRPS